MEMYDFLFGALYLSWSTVSYYANQYCWNKNYDETILSSFKELNMKMRIKDILIVLLVLPASYSAVTLTMTANEKEGIKQFVGKSSPIIRSLIKFISQGIMNWSWRLLRDPISEEELETIYKTSSTVYLTVQLKVNQVHNSQN